MKIIGNGYDGDLLCVINVNEVCRVFGHYNRYSSDVGVDELKRGLKVGCELDLGIGYDFRKDIQDACRKTIDAFKSFGEAQKTMLAFCELITKQEDAK
jgi:hypothetical protein